MKQIKNIDDLESWSFIEITKIILFSKQFWLTGLITVGGVFLLVLIGKLT